MLKVANDWPVVSVENINAVTNTELRCDVRPSVCLHLGRGRHYLLSVSELRPSHSADTNITITSMGRLGNQRESFQSCIQTLNG